VCTGTLDHYERAVRLQLSWERNDRKVREEDAASVYGHTGTL
jgi:hypothetical protein